MEVLSKFIPNFKIENIERDNKELNKSIILTLKEQEINISSSPFLCSILEYYFKLNNNQNQAKKNLIILIGEKESLNFYATIGRKLGINLLKKDNGFIFVDIIGMFAKLLSTELPLEENYPDTFNPVKKDEDEYIICDKKLVNYDNLNLLYQEIFNRIKEKINEKKSENKITIIFDKVNDDSLASIDEIIKYCFSNDVNLIFTINKDINSEKVCNYLEYLSDILFEIKKNESGFSKDINGIIDINIKLDQRQDKKCYRYNLKTNEIKILTHIDI